MGVTEAVHRAFVTILANTPQVRTEQAQIRERGKARVQRVDDQIAVKGSAADPWTLADDRVLASLASKSADDLAAILSNMPEAVAGGAAMATVASAGPALNSQGSSSFR